MSLPTREDVPRELRLLGLTSDEARAAVEKFLDDAALAGHREVRLVHGKGTGALRRAVEGCLRGHPLVSAFRLAEPAAGGAGATVVALDGDGRRRGSRAAPRRGLRPEGEPMRVPPEVLDEIRARVDLVDLVGAVVPLKRAGERWKGLCPFHQEKTPSFTVHPKLHLFHCFGCHAGGDVFEFLRRHDHLEFPEAVRLLADRAGVPLPGREATPEAGARDGLFTLMEWAARRFETWLWEGDAAERARAYLDGRGIGREIARAFRLGYAPEGWDHLLGAARQDGHPVEALLGAGLVLSRQTGPGHYDRFRGRLIFPIVDTQGRVIAFGGRALAGEEPKYLNSPETPLYQKGQTLYGLHRARETMTASRRALLVEGYVDCLMAHQHGVGETVAVLGTALTPAQLGLLRRYADEAILFFDADRAGQEAARRAEDLLEQSSAPDRWMETRRANDLTRAGLRLKVATLPAGHDPDTFLRAEGRDAFEACCRAARPLLLFALDRVFAEEDTTSPRGRIDRRGARRPHALEGPGRRRGDRARPRGRPAARRRRERPLEPGAAARRGWAPGRRLEPPRPPAARPRRPPRRSSATWASCSSRRRRRGRPSCRSSTRRPSRIPRCARSRRRSTPIPPSRPPRSAPG